MEIRRVWVQAEERVKVSWIGVGPCIAAPQKGRGPTRARPVEGSTREKGTVQNHNTASVCKTPCLDSPTYSLRLKCGLRWSTRLYRLRC